MYITPNILTGTGSGEILATQILSDDFYLFVNSYSLASYDIQCLPKTLQAVNSCENFNFPLASSVPTTEIFVLGDTYEELAILLY